MAALLDLTSNGSQLSDAEYRQLSSLLKKVREHGEDR